MKYVLEESLQGYIINSVVPDKVIKVVKPRALFSTAMSVVTDETVVYIGTPSVDADIDKKRSSLPKNYLVIPTYPMETTEKKFVDTSKYCALSILSALPAFKNELSAEDLELFNYLAVGLQNTLGVEAYKYRPELDTDEFEKTIIYYSQNRFSSLSSIAKLIKANQCTDPQYAYLDNVLETDKEYINKKLNVANIATVTSKYSGSKLTVGVVYAERLMGMVALKLLDKIHREGHKDAITVIQNANYIMLVMDTDNKELVDGLASKNVSGGHGKYTLFINGLVDMTLFEALKAELQEDNE